MNTEHNDLALAAVKASYAITKAEYYAALRLFGLFDPRLSISQPAVIVNTTGCNLADSSRPSPGPLYEG